MAEPGMKEIKIMIPEELFALLVPAEALDHVRSARKEMLLALRSVIDSRIAHLEKKEAKRSESKKKIKVD